VGHNPVRVREGIHERRQSRRVADLQERRHGLDSQRADRRGEQFEQRRERGGLTDVPQETRGHGPGLLRSFRAEGRQRLH